MKVTDLKNIKFNDGKIYENKETKMSYKLSEKPQSIGKENKLKINYSRKGQAGTVKHNTMSNKLTYSRKNSAVGAKRNSITKKLSYKKRNGDAYTVTEIILIVAIVILVIGIILAGASIFLNYSLRM
ncbi:hypothetical protein [uncultured Clostridium sp.]|uniref:hypothetical protein n=1 Tax=uncultured Clostridium sp. TaxID=59620 RepID=UPI002619F8B3|nr:hypothetical protein [uncultured Clostridium sp.]